MRKLTLIMKPNIIMARMLKPVFKHIEKIEMREMLRMDFDKGQKIGVGDLHVKEGVDLTKIKVHSRMRIIDILEQKGNIYTCLISVQVPKSQQKMLKMFDFDLIYDIPTTTSPEKLTYSVIGEEKNLKKFLTLMKLIGKQEKVIYKNADYRGIGISSSLTKKQEEIVNSAIEWGYYSYPRKISTNELAKRIGIRKSTLVEHLRKAENRVMNKVFVK